MTGGSQVSFEGYYEGRARTVTCQVRQLPVTAFACLP